MQPLNCHSNWSMFSVSAKESLQIQKTLDKLCHFERKFSKTSKFCSETPNDSCHHFTSAPESSLKHETNSRVSNGYKIIALRLAVRLGFCNFHSLRMRKLGYFGVSQLNFKERF